MVQYLLEAGAKAEAKDFSGRDAYTHALMHRKLDCAKLLLPNQVVTPLTDLEAASLKTKETSRVFFFPLA